MIDPFCSVITPLLCKVRCCIFSFPLLIKAVVLFHTALFLTQLLFFFSGSCVLSSAGFRIMEICIIYVCNSTQRLLSVNTFDQLSPQLVFGDPFHSQSGMHPWRIIWSPCLLSPRLFREPIAFPERFISIHGRQNTLGSSRNDCGQLLSLPRSQPPSIAYSSPPRISLAALFQKNHYGWRYAVVYIYTRDGSLIPVYNVI